MTSWVWGVESVWIGFKSEWFQYLDLPLQVSSVSLMSIYMCQDHILRLEIWIRLAWMPLAYIEQDLGYVSYPLIVLPHSPCRHRWAQPPQDLSAWVPRARWPSQLQASHHPRWGNLILLAHNCLWLFKEYRVDQATAMSPSSDPPILHCSGHVLLLCWMCVCIWRWSLLRR